MEVALRQVGLGIVSYTDTGAGITPDNFESNCCGWFGLTFAPDVCHGFVSQNASLFGGYYSPCARGALANLRTPLPVTTMAPVAPPVIDTTPGQPPGNDVWSPPYSEQTPACTGRKVVTEDDAKLLQLCLAQRQAAQQAADVAASMRTLAADQCAAIKAECQNRTFAQFLSPSDDCTDCVFDWKRTSSLFLILGFALVGFAFLKR